MSNGFGDEQREVATAGLGRAMTDHRPPGITEKLLQEKKELELRLEAITQLLDQLQASPETQEILDNMAKLGRGMF